MLHVNFSRHFIEELVLEGYQIDKEFDNNLEVIVLIQSDQPRGKWFDNHPQGRKVKVVVKTIEISPTKMINIFVINYFKNLQSLLELVTKKLGKVTLYLPEGDVIPLPDSFKSFCDGNEIEATSITWRQHVSKDTEEAFGELMDEL